MSGYILCQVKQAELPYYIENISTNIYSIEELCFYIYHNIYLLDDTILNEELCFWIRDQLGLKKLAENLYKHLDEEEMKVGDFILPIFKEINYLSLEEFRKLNQQIQQLAMEPEVVRQKRKGDYLMEHGKYVNAIKVYQKALRQGKDQILGGIYHNMGCAYTRLFQMEEARSCFQRAYEKLDTPQTKKSLLSAIYLEQGIDAFVETAKSMGVDDEEQEAIYVEAESVMQELFTTPDGQEYQKLLEKKAAQDQEAYQAGMNQLLRKMTEEYHRSTGY